MKRGVGKGEWEMGSGKRGVKNRVGRGEGEEETGEG